MQADLARVDARRVAFVTEHFLELQGLIPAAYGGALLFALLMYQSVDTSGRSGTASQAWVLGMVVASQAVLYLHASYKRTFGDVVATKWQRAVAMLPTMLPMIGALVDMSLQFDGRSGPNCAAVAVASYSFWVVLRDWPWRRHCLAGGAAGLAAGLVTAAVAASPGQFGIDPARSNAFVLAYSLVALGLIANGLGDHLLLTWWLRPSVDIDTNPGALAWWGLRRAWAGICVGCASAATLALSDRFLDLFPINLILAFIAGILVPSVTDALRAVRDLGKRPLVVPERGSVLRIGEPEVVAVATVALSAIIHVALLWPSRPMLPALTILVSSLGLAFTSTTRAPHVIRSAAVAAALALFPMLSPPRAVIALVGALAIGIVSDALRQFRVQAHRGFEPARHAGEVMDTEDANTI